MSRPGARVVGGVRAQRCLGALPFISSFILVQRFSDLMLGATPSRTSASVCLSRYTFIEARRVARILTFPTSSIFGTPTCRGSSAVSK